MLALQAECDLETMGIGAGEIKKLMTPTHRRTLGGAGNIIGSSIGSSVRKGSGNSIENNLFED
jgi:hypothetical protein